MKQMLGMIEHITHDNAGLSEQLISAVANGIRDNDREAVQPYFRAAKLLITSDESRTDAVLTAIVDVMKSQDMFYFGTEFAIKYFSLLGKLAPVAAWCKDNAEKFAWMAEWLETNVEEPYYTREGMTLRKPGAVALRTQELDYRSPTILANLKSLPEGGDLVQCGYESEDDPEVLMHKRVKVQWQGNKWYSATVVSYNSSTGLHHVIYDDDDRRDYNMPQKNFEFSEEQRFPYDLRATVVAALKSYGVDYDGRMMEKPVAAPADDPPAEAHTANPVAATYVAESSDDADDGDVASDGAVGGHDD